MPREWRKRTVGVGGNGVVVGAGVLVAVAIAVAIGAVAIGALLAPLALGCVVDATPQAVTSRGIVTITEI
jgi:hypothetical protein